MKLSKTNFLIYRDCAHNAWLKMHKPDVYEANPPSVFDQSIMEAGNEVDVRARELFPGGVLVARGDARNTARLVAQRTPVLYQPVFETDRYTMACDVLVWDAAANVYDLYEVKSSTGGGGKDAKDKVYTYDLAFQTAVLCKNRVPLGRTFVVRLDGKYVLGERLDVQSLFSLDDFSERVGLIRELVAKEMATAYEALQSESEPPPCACLRKARSRHCTTFAHTNPGVPEYSVHDITHISKRKLGKLIVHSMLAIEDLPDDFELSDAQRNQVRAANTKQTMIDTTAIKNFLSGVLYLPIAFLDYETYPSAIPRFANYRPYDHIPFQFSLDIIDRPAGDHVHHEFLHTQAGSPDTDLLTALKAVMPDTGSVMTWNKTFEKGINERLGTRNPDAKKFLMNVNERVVDLMDVFSGQSYVHPEFKGKTSIKHILPVLVPSLSYKDLAIQEGATATARWNEIVTGKVNATTAGKLRTELLRYCGLDTRAMVEIWRALVRTVGGN